MVKSASEQLAEELGKYYADPLGYVMFAFPWSTEPSIQKVKLVSPYAERFSCEWGPDVWACEFLDDLGKEIKKRKFDGTNSVQPIRFSTASGHGIGKSALVAWLIKFILDTRPFAKGIVTANTSEQLKTKTWAELAKWHSLSITEHLYHYTSGRGMMSLYRIGSKRVQSNWRCDAQTCREENSEAFQGLHSASSTPFFIFDEASGIPDKIWEARSGGMTDGEPMSFDFGNPTRKSGMFFENCIGRYRHRYIVRSIDSRSVQITNKALIQEWIEDWGDDSDFFKVKVRGVFPSAGSVQFINSDDVQAAMLRIVSYDRTSPLLIGVDCARFGENSTVIYPRIGYDAKSFGYKEFKGLDTTQVVEKVIETLQEFRSLGRKCNGLFVDGGGLGGGIVDLLRKLGYNPIDINFGSSAADGKYYRKGDEMWGRMRADLHKLAIVNDPHVYSQMTQREYGFTPHGGKIRLESKELMRDRGIESPDIIDALALTWAHSVASDGPEEMMKYMREAKSEYNPLEVEW